MFDENYIFLGFIFIAYFLGIRSANDSWIRNASKEQLKECRGKLYKVQEEE